MKKSALLLLCLGLILSGCDSTDLDPVAVTSNRVNILRVVDPTPDLAVNGQSVTIGRVTGFDSSGQRVFGPDEEVYDEEMVFSGISPSTTDVEIEFERAQGFTLARYSQSVDFVSDEDGVITLNQVQPELLAATPDTFNIRIVNDSAYTADEVFVTVLGKDAQDTAFYFLQLGANGTNNTMELFGDRSTSANYSFALSDTVAEEVPNTYSFECPYDKLVSGRIYLSFGEKLEGLGLADTQNPLSLVTPSPTGAPDFQKVFEFMELSATIQPNAGAEYILFANTSVVDFFSIGLGMTLDYHDPNTGSNLSEQVGFVDGARGLVLDAFADASVPVEFQSYVTDPNTSKTIRVLAPVQTVAINPQGDTASFLDSAINAGWIEYASSVLNLPDNLSFTYGYAYAGQLIVNNILTMTTTTTPPGDNASLNEVCNLPKPTSRIIFFCDDDMPPANTPVRDTWQNAGTDGHKRLCSLLSSAINRGVFENYADWDQASKFYTRPDGKYNHYSKIMHQFAIDNKVYGFGYDDVYGQDPTLSEAVSTVNQVVLEIPAFERIGQ